MKQKKTKGKGAWKRALLITLCVVLAVILLGLIAVAILLNDWMGAIDRIDPGDESTMSSQDVSQWIEDNRETEESMDPNVPVIDPDDIIWSAPPTENQDPEAPTTAPTEPEPVDLIGDEEHIVNILLIGSDRRPGEGRGRSDAMILCTVNTQTYEFTMTSILRDLYVQIPGHQGNRVNAAYAFGGTKLLNQTLEQNFHIHVDGNVVVDFNSFSQVVDMVGGVPIYLTEKEANYMNGEGGWDLKEGSNWLNGEQALEYSRIRYIDSDFNRTNRQRTVLKALVRSATSMDVGQVLSVAKQMLKLVSTDLSDAEILGYVTKLFPVLTGAELKTQAIPQNDAFQDVYIDEMRVLLLDLAKTRQFLRDTLLG